MHKLSKHFTIRSVLLLICAFAFLSTCVLAQSETARKECGVNGTITDQYGATVLGANITYTNALIRKTVEADENGKYSLAIPRGVYSISVGRGVSKARYERAKVELTCLQNVELNIVLLPECVSYGCRKLGYSFATFTRGWASRSDLNIVIAYNSKTQSRGRTTYSRGFLTFDTYTLSADKIFQDFKSKSFLAEGNVWLENGRNRTTYQKLTITFTRDGVILQ